MRRAAVGVVLGVLLIASPAGAKPQKLTIQQVASAVAELRPDLIADLGNVADDCGPLADCTEIGHIELVTLKAQVETLDVNLGYLNRPSKKVVRPFPKTIGPLVTKTRAALVKVARDTNTTEACFHDPAASCLDERLSLSFSGSALRTALLGWDAYL